METKNSHGNLEIPHGLARSPWPQAAGDIAALSSHSSRSVVCGRGFFRCVGLENVDLTRKNGKLTSKNCDFTSKT
jgi:hypothetical protein